MKTLLLTITAIFILGACAGKQYFEPEETEKFNEKTSSIDSKIKSFNRSGATLENGYYISSTGVSKNALPKEFEFINNSNGVIIATNNKDKILLNDEIIEINEVIVAASLENENLALVFSNNTIAIYNTTEKKIVFKEYFKESVANDTRITNPLFMNNLVLFPTLDGKVIVVSKLENKSVKTIVVDPDSTFNNIIYLDVVGETLIAATNNKVISVGTGALSVKDYEIREIITTKENIYIGTIDGQLIKLDFNLNEIASKKYKFAKFYALAYKDALYALESQGYLIKIEEDFLKDTVYDFSFSSDSKAITVGDAIYFKDKLLRFK
ncbi:MAG: hypothetical protein WC141_00605 [Arcobacteraceae bacterium]